MLTDEVRDARAWVRHSVAPADWRVPFPDAASAELEAFVGAIRKDPLPVLMLEPADFQLRACAEVMAAVRRTLREGIGLAVVDRVPVERFTSEESRAVAWLLGRLLGRPVAQKWDGTMIYDVRDTGKVLDYSVRRSVTNLELEFHTDAPWLRMPPELVGLLCVHPAREGGVSRFVSLVTVHNELRRRHPRLLPRLYRPFPWNRQAEHAAGDPRVAAEPVFETDGGTLLARWNHALIESGEALAGAPLDAEGREALAAMRAVAEAPERSVEFTIERGQLQYLDNRQFAHSRTHFRDADEPERKRHLIRIWVRDAGRPTFHG